MKNSKRWVVLFDGEVQSEFRRSCDAMEDMVNRGKDSPQDVKLLHVAMITHQLNPWTGYSRNRIEAWKIGSFDKDKMAWKSVEVHGLPADGAWVAVIHCGRREHGCLIDGAWHFAHDRRPQPERRDLWLPLPDLPEPTEAVQ